MPEIEAGARAVVADLRVTLAPYLEEVADRAAACAVLARAHEVPNA